jgi:hypothetical protein
MSRRTAAWLAWSLAGLALATAVANVLLQVISEAAREEVSVGSAVGGAIAELVVGVPLLAFPLAGALIATRRPYNPIGWILLVDGLLWMLLDTLVNYGTYGVAKPGSVPFPVAIASLSNWLWVPAVGLLGTYLLLLFPNGGLPSGRWRPLAWLSGIVILVLSVGRMLEPGPLETLEHLKGVQNPLGLEGASWLRDAGFVVLPLLPLCMVASALSLVLRYRRSGGEEREQIKWIAFAGSFMVMVYLAVMSAGLVVRLVSGPEAPMLDELSWWGPLQEYVLVLSFTAVPVAIGFAVLKYRLYDIDILINRTLVYGALTASLALVYFGGVTTTQALFSILTDQRELPQLVVVASTLLIAALFNPLRRRIQTFIDRRFYRKKYDARKTLEAFSAKLRDETDLEALNDDLVGVVRETMQPAHVSLWLRPDPSLRIAEGPE